MQLGSNVTIQNPLEHLAWLYSQYFQIVVFLKDNVTLWGKIEFMDCYLRAKRPMFSFFSASIAECGLVQVSQDRPELKKDKRE